MNSRERVLTALRGGKPDRVPVAEFLVDERVARAAAPEGRDLADCLDRMGYDGFGCGAHFRRVEEYADGSYRDEWGVLYRPGPEAVAHPLRGPIRTLADARAYTPPDPAAPGRLGRLPELVERYRGRRAICFHHRAAFMWSAYLMGMEEILIGFLEEPELVELVLDKVLACNLEIVRRAIRAGAEVIVLGDDYAANAGPLMSPAVFAHFLQPRLKRMIDLIHEEGALCIKHSDGNLYPLLEMILACGPDGLNPIEPVAGMELGRTRELVGPKVCLCGNIDCAHLLPHGSPAEVRAAVQTAVAAGGANGAFILTSSNSIHSSCRPENVLAMLAAAGECAA